MNGPSHKTRTSKIPWLELIPESWGELRAKFLFFRCKHPVQKDDGIVTAFRDGEVTLRTNRRTEGFTFATKEIGYQGVKKGDLVIHAMDAFAGAIGVSDSNGKCSPVYSVCQPVPQALPQFYAYVLRQMATTGYIMSLAKGIRERSTAFGFGEFKEQILPTPPLKEQQAIASYLDRKTAAIDSLIEKKERLIALLEEKRAALINQAVTKGLDPNVPMKDSGVPWIGQIPAHWSCAPVYAYFDVQLGKMLSPDAKSGEHIAPYLRNTNIQWDRVVLDDLKEMNFSPSDRVKFSLRPGDLLVCEGGDVGRSAVWEGQIDDCFYQKALHRLRPRRSGRSTRFLMFSLYAASHIGEFLAEGNKSTIAHLTAEKLRVHRFACPPTDEGVEIVRFLDSKLKQQFLIEGKLRKIIELLQERRQALITAAVTGKIDVTGEAA
jgi:type I restriction enzyme S subunit